MDKTVLTSKCFTTGIMLFSLISGMNSDANATNNRSYPPGLMQCERSVYDILPQGSFSRENLKPGELSEGMIRNGFVINADSGSSLSFFLNLNPASGKMNGLVTREIESVGTLYGFLLPAKRIQNGLIEFDMFGYLTSDERRIFSVVASKLRIRFLNQSAAFPRDRKLRIFRVEMDNFETKDYESMVALETGDFDTVQVTQFHVRPTKLTTTWGTAENPIKTIGSNRNSSPEELAAKQTQVRAKIADLYRQSFLNDFKVELIEGRLNRQLQN